MKKNGATLPFLAYANLSLQREIRNLKDIVSSLRQFYGDIPEISEHLPTAIELCIKYSEMDYKDALELAKILPFALRFGREDPYSLCLYGKQEINEAKRLLIQVTDGKFKTGKDFIISWSLDEAFEYIHSVYNPIMKPCERECHFRKERREIIGRSMLKGDNRLRCYECDQLYFISILDNIIDGRNASEIPGFDTIKSLGNKLVRTYIIQDNLNKVMTNNKVKLKHVWNVPKYWEDEIRLYDIVLGLICHNLLHFMAVSDIDKLKKCDNCHIFFLANRANQKYCTTQCKNNYHNKQKSREEIRQAVQKHRKEKKSKHKNEVKKRRLNHMINMGWMPEEALEYIDNELEDLV